MDDIQNIEFLLQLIVCIPKLFFERFLFWIQATATEESGHLTVHKNFCWKSPSVLQVIQQLFSLLVLTMIWQLFISLTLR